VKKKKKTKQTKQKIRKDAKDLVHKELYKIYYKTSIIIVGVIVPVVYIYVYIGAGAQFEDISSPRTGKHCHGSLR